jgi:hypothetical protein
LVLLCIVLVSPDAVDIQPLVALLLRLLKLFLVLVAAYGAAIHLVMILLLAWEARLPRRQRASVGHIRRLCIRLWTWTRPNTGYVAKGANARGSLGLETPAICQKERKTVPGLANFGTK